MTREWYFQAMGQELGPLSSRPIPAIVIKLFEEEENESHPPSVEFYDFVGFREAISPVLHDAVKHFATNRGIKLSQLNRRALATFIERPELAMSEFFTITLHGDSPSPDS